MTAEPSVSVVIPAHNAERFIARAIESVFAQTHAPIECVVVDDGSTDGTRAVVASIQDTRLRLLEQTNQGVAGARNSGAAATTGELIAFLDADDAWLPRKLELQVDLYRRRPELGLIYSGLHLVDAEGSFIGRMSPADEAEALVRTLLIEKPYMTGIGSTGMVPRATFDAVQGFDTRMSTAADRDLACRIACTYPVAPVAHYPVLYTQHPDQMHHDPEVVLRDVTLMFDKIFSSDSLPFDISRSRRRAEANLYVSLAGSYARMGRRGPLLRYAMKAIYASPARVLAAAARLMSVEGPSGYGVLN